MQQIVWNARELHYVKKIQSQAYVLYDYTYITLVK